MDAIPEQPRSDSRPKILAVGLIALIACSLFLTSTVAPSFYGFKGYWTYDAKRLLELTLLPLIFLGAVTNAQIRAATVHQFARMPLWVVVALASLAMIGVASAAVNATSNASLGNSLADVFLLALLVVGAVSVAACCEAGGRSVEVLIAATLVMIPLAIGAQEILGVFAVRSSGLEFDFYTALPSFHFPRFYNQMQSWMIPSTLAAVTTFNRRRLIAGLVVVALALHWYVVLETGARGTALGVAVATGVCAALLPQIRRVMLRFQAAGLLAGIAVFTLLVVLAPPPVSTEPVDPPTNAATATLATPPHGDSLVGAVGGERMWTSTGRFGLWRSALDDALRNPGLGIGPGNYACRGWPSRAAHPHSFPLQILSEWGIPAFIVLVALTVSLGAMTVRRLRKTKSERSRRAAMLFTGVVAAATHACFSGVMLMPASQLTGLLIVGWLLAAVPRHGFTGTWRERGAIPVLILATAISIGLAWFGWQSHEKRQALYSDTTAWNLALPRFWHNGKVCP